MAFVDRTAYPRLPSMVSARELADAFTPPAEEVTWACAKVLGPGSRLVMLVMLKCYQRLGYFPQIDRVPPEVVEYVCAQAVEVLGDRVGPLWRQPDRTIRRCRELVREYTGAVGDPQRMRGVAESAMRAALLTRYLAKSTSLTPSGVRVRKYLRTVRCRI